MRGINLSLTAIIILFTGALSFAGVPQKFNYQAIARDGAGTLLVNQNVSLRFTILDGGPSGTEAYKETHTTNTDANGLVSAQVGNGSVVSGKFADIEWSKGNIWLKTEVDPGSGYVLIGSQELMSVPYALVAEKANSLELKDDQGNVYKLGLSSTNSNLITTIAVSPPTKKVVWSSDASLSLAGPDIDRYIDAQGLEIYYQEKNLKGNLGKLEYSFDGVNYSTSPTSLFINLSTLESMIPSFSVSVPNNLNPTKIYLRYTPCNEAGCGPVSDIIELDLASGN
ncbi:MAG: hypothetical protein GY827_00440 [Cytophagales bacterium]|nr:hypothetical protein [Cytophagales bacterium]